MTTPPPMLVPRWMLDHLRADAAAAYPDQDPDLVLAREARARGFSGVEVYDR